jgi:hypothetical protein
LLAILTFAPVNTIAAVGVNVIVKTADCWGARIMPAESPLVVTPAPVAVTLEMVMFEFPLLVRVEDSEVLLPTEIVLKFRLVGAAPSCTVDAPPVPDRAIVSDAGAPLVASVMDPFTAAVVVGVKIALKATLPPAGMVVAVDRPEIVNPAPGGVTFENVRVELPPFCSVMVCELLVPFTTVPKLTLAGIAEICAWSPVPASGIVSGEFEASLVTVKVPVTELSDNGVNRTWSEVPWPTGMEPDGLPPTIVKAAPKIVAVEMLTAALPVLLKFTVCVPTLPTATLPKLRLVVTVESVPELGFTFTADPTPDRGIVSVEGVPLVTRVMDPLTLAAESGVKIALKAKLPPAGMVVAVERPDMLNPAPGGVTCENVRVELPPFCSVMVCELLFPFTTVPKLTLAGVAEIIACMPVPDRGIVSGELEALLVTVKIPVTALSDKGAN